MKITGTSRDSRCLYCDSTAYGKGCMYGPNKTHVHVDDPRRCVYCGSTATGYGCVYNPLSKLHQKGIGFNPITLESLENGIIQGIIMKRLSTPISESKAYRLGLIDEHGNLLREPSLLEERKALTGVDKYLIKVKNILKEKLDILNLSLYYENKDLDSLDDIAELYPIELECKDDLAECMSKLVKISEEYESKGLPTGKFEQLLIEALMNATND